MHQIVQPFVDAFVLVAAVILLTRINGLRSFAKMSSFDFAMTVAIGSALAGTILGDPDDLPGGLATLVALFAVQAAIAILRLKWRRVEAIVDNTPIMLMRDGRVLEDGMAAGRVTREDLTALLRRAGVRRVAEVHAVVLETTGDVSVLAGGDGIDAELVGSVRAGGADAIGAGHDAAA